MAFRITPREDKFFDLFAASAQHLVTGSDLLGQVLASTKDERGPLAKRLSDVEHEADESVHAIMRLVNASFITPFDREDIQELATSLDDCMDHMEEAGDLIVLYRLDEIPKRIYDMVEILQRASEITAEAMPKLRAVHSLNDFCVEINRLENKADKKYRKLLAELFDSDVDVKTLLKLKDVIDALEDAADAFEQVAIAVETIMVKES